MLTAPRNFAAPIAPIAPIAPPKRNPVLLIHGLKDSAARMERMANYLRSEGWQADTMSLRPSWGQLGLDELARQIDAEARRLYPEGQKFDLVGFSMGGLVSRYYLQRLGGIDRVERFITLSTPHNGTWMAYAIPNAGCRQMRPNSEFLRDLATDQDAQLARVHFTSFWTPLDAIIVPASSSKMAAAHNVRLWVVAHPLMIWQRGCLKAVAAALMGH
jgi:triacylglycerol lipase